MTEPAEILRRIAIAAPSLGDEEAAAVCEVLRSGWLTQGPRVAAFEQAFAKRHQVRHAVATTSCTTGLHLALLSLGIGPGDEVIVPSFTWVATANAVIHCGATPVVADVDPATFNIDAADAARRVTKRTKAVIAVHLFGLPADMKALRAALPVEVHLVEDAACAAGAEYHGRPAGGLGDVAAFSFHPRKTVTTGEGGMITTNDPGIAERAAIMRNHGASVSEEARHAGARPYLLPDFDVLGFNYRMTDLQAAVGSVQLGRLDALLAERARWAAFYGERLVDVAWLRVPAVPEGCGHAWQSYVVSVDPACAPLPRDRIMERLEAMGVSVRPGTHAVHMLGYYRERFGFQPEDYPGARDCAANGMAIPLHNRMAAEDYDYIVDALHRIG